MNTNRPTLFAKLSVALQRIFLFPVLSVFVSTIGIFVPSAFAERSVTATWESLLDGNTNQARVAKVTDAGGTLHIVTRVERSLLDTYQYRTISSAGVVSATTDILVNWSSLNYPALLLKSDGSLSILFSGLRTTVTADPYSSGRLYRLTSDTTRSVWTLDSVIYPSSNSVYVQNVAGSVYGSEQEIAVHPGGATDSSWPRAYNVSTSVASDADAQSCCSYSANSVISQTTGEFFAGWYSNTSNLHGYYFQALFPAKGALLYAPGSANSDRSASLSPSGAVPLVAHRNQLYTAYCNGYVPCTGVRVWQLGSASGFVDVARSAKAKNISLTSDGSRLWSTWTVNSKLYAARTNAAGSRFGETLAVSLPAGATTVYRTQSEAARGHLDFFINSDGSGATNTKYARIGVPIEMRISPSRIRRLGGFVRAVVTDGDSPLPGVRITGGSAAAVTSASGIARIRIRAGRAAVRLVATKTGYTGARASVSRTR